MKLGMDIAATAEQVSDLRFAKNIFAQEGGAQLKVQVYGVSGGRFPQEFGHSFVTCSDELSGIFFFFWKKKIYVRAPC